MKTLLAILYNYAQIPNCKRHLRKLQQEIICLGYNFKKGYNVSMQLVAIKFREWY